MKTGSGFGLAPIYSRGHEQLIAMHFIRIRQDATTGVNC